MADNQGLIFRTETMHPTLFRVIPVTDSSIRGEPQSARGTTRIPINVPYVIDNVWEYLRPAAMPCRRHAVYASPTPELAVSHITAAAKGRGTAVYKLVVSGTAEVAQLAVEDAKLHIDIRAIGAIVQASSAELMNSPWEAKQAASVLFIPRASKADLRRCVEGSSFAAEFVRQASAKSTFWWDAKVGVFNPTGEVFFVLAALSTYALKSLATA